MDEVSEDATVGDAERSVFWIFGFEAVFAGLDPLEYTSS
jgi:hypothetical protein